MSGIELLNDLSHQLSRTDRSRTTKIVVGLNYLCAALIGLIVTSFLSDGEGYILLIPSGVGLILIFIGLGLSLWEGHEWAYWLNLLIYGGGTILFLTHLTPSYENYYIALLMCIVIDVVLIVERIHLHIAGTRR